MEIQIIRKANKKSLCDEYMALVSGGDLPKNSRLLTLRQKLAEDNVIRCDGKLNHAEFLSFL